MTTHAELLELVAYTPGRKWRRRDPLAFLQHDPRWHVQPIRRAFHVNDHLGFRCCYAVGGER